MPSVRREVDMGSREDGDKVVFSGTNCSFHRERAMVVGRDILKSDRDREKEVRSDEVSLSRRRWVRG